MGVRAVARAHLVLGSAALAFALYAVTLNPADFQLQGHECAATAAVLLLLCGVTQAVAAMAAGVAMEAGALDRSLTVVAHLLSLHTAWYLHPVAGGVAVVALGHCLGHHYLVMLVLGYVAVAVPSCLLFLTGLAVALCGPADG